MSLLGRMGSVVPDPIDAGPPAEAAANTGGHEPRGSDALHLLIYNDPADPAGPYGQGWTLVAWQGTERRWSIALAAHGANGVAEARVAKAVAVRVLNDRGVRVEGWSDGFVSGLPMHRAVLEEGLVRQAERDSISAPSVPAPRGPSARLDMEWTGWRRGRPPGH